MKIYPVSDPAFVPYGRVVEGYDTKGILEAMQTIPMPEKGTMYEPKMEVLHTAPGAQELGEALFGGMPFQFGCTRGYNTKLNCAEYHRDSEFGIGTVDYIMLLACQQEIVDGKLDTSKVKAFYVPAGTLVEIYATTLHYAPCQAKAGTPYRVLVVLPEGTNTPYQPAAGKAANLMDSTLWARNKWLIAHPDTYEAKKGAYVGLTGENVDVAADI